MTAPKYVWKIQAGNFIRNIKKKTYQNITKFKIFTPLYLENRKSYAKPVGKTQT